MAIGTGLSSQIGFAEQSSYGTFVTPDRFYEFNSEDVRANVQKIYGGGISRSRFRRKDRVRTYVTSAGGSIEFDVLTHGFGLLFKHMLGRAESEQVGAGDEYKHTFTANPDGLAGMALSFQKGVPATDGTVHPFNYVGGKVTEWELNCALDEALKLSTTLDFKGIAENEPLATPSYPAEAQMLTFIDGSVSFGGATIKVNTASVSGSQGLDVERRKVGNDKNEPLENAELEITGNMEMDFEALQRYQDFIAGNTGELVLTFACGEIDEGSDNPFKLVVTCPAIEFTGDTPTVGGTEVVTQPLPFKALYDDSTDLIIVEYHTTDVEP